METRLRPWAEADRNSLVRYAGVIDLNGVTIRGIGISAQIDIYRKKS